MLCKNHTARISELPLFDKLNVKAITLLNKFQFSYTLRSDQCTETLKRKQLEELKKKVDRSKNKELAKMAEYFSLKIRSVVS